MTRKSAMTLDRRRHDGVVALMATMLEGTTDLRGAACTANPHLFDPDVPAETLGLTDIERWRAVQATCIGCPARAACWDWATSVGNHGRPRGPLADSMNDPFASSRRWERRRAASDPEAEEPAPTVTRDRKPNVTPRPRRCAGRGCSRPVLAQGLCEAHYRRLKRNPHQPRDRLLRPLRRSPRPKASEPLQEPPGGPDPPTQARKPSRSARRRIRPSINRSRRHRR